MRFRNRQRERPAKVYRTENTQAGTVARCTLICAGQNWRFLSHLSPSFTATLAKVWTQGIDRSTHLNQWAARSPLQPNLISSKFVLSSKQCMMRNKSYSNFHLRRNIREEYSLWYHCEYTGIKQVGPKISVASIPNHILSVVQYKYALPQCEWHKQRSSDKHRLLRITRMSDNHKVK